MMVHIYPSALEKLLRENQSLNYIPRKLFNTEKFKLYHRYWTEESDNSFFKIENVFECDKEQYCQLKYSIEWRQGIICNTIDDKTLCYELMLDRHDIISIDNIVNYNIPLYGSEIKYWFFIHNIDLNTQGSKYYNFKSYIDMLSKNVISDYKMYYLKAELKNGIYSNSYILLS